MLCFWWKSYKMCPSSFASCWSLNSWCNTGHDVQSQIRQQEKVFYLLLLRRLPRAYRPLFLSLTRSLPLTHSLWSNCAQFTAVISPMSRVSLEPPCQKKIFYSNYYFISQFIFEVFFLTFGEVNRQKSEDREFRRVTYEKKKINCLKMFCASPFVLLQSVASIQVPKLHTKKK